MLVQRVNVSGGTAVYLYNGTYTWALNNTTISKSSASIISYGGAQYSRGAYVTTYKNPYYSIQAYQLCSYNPNTAPTVDIRTVSGTEDMAVALTLAATDPDAGDTHSFTLVSAPSSAVGIVSISGNRATFLLLRTGTAPPHSPTRPMTLPALPRMWPLSR